MHITPLVPRYRTGSVLLTVMILTVIAALLLTSLLSLVSHDGLMVQDGSQRRRYECS